MIKLTELSSKYGAPMGRSAIHATGLTDPLFELERVPYVDDCYDVGGAYWGGGEPLWVADFTTPLTSTTIVHYYLRAKDREAAMAEVRETYPSAKFKPETGSVIEQTIEFLENFLAQEDNLDDDDDTAQDTRDEISDLQTELELIKCELRRPKGKSA